VAVRQANDDEGDRADRASDAFRIGVDTEGCDHIFSRIRMSVTVRDDDTVVHTHSLADCHLSHWLTYIDETRGWDTTRGDDW
jgi:Fe-S cluster assembly iron-binding protein IscA